MLSFCAVAGCSHPKIDLRTQLEAYDPVDRIRAIIAVAELQKASLVPALVDRLDDTDAAVRMYAIIALEKLTDTRLGYGYAASASERRAAVARWRQYVREGAKATQQATVPIAQTQGDG